MKHDEVSVPSDSWRALVVDIDQLRTALNQLSLSLKDLLYEADHLHQRIQVDRMASDLIRRAARQEFPVESSHPPK